MSDYTKTTNFAAKDSLPSGNSGKIVKGSEIDTEFTNIQTAVATKLDINNSALTGTTTAQTLSISTLLDVNANATFGDGNKAIFGTGSDLQIYHDGTDSYITEVGNGNLIVKAAGGTLFQGATAGESLLTLLENGAVTAYYDNAAKLATTSTGIDVTGSVVSDGLTVEKTSNGANVSVASLQNDGSGANTKADLDFHAANTKYATISGGYGASAPELDIKVGNTPSIIATFTETGVGIGTNGTPDAKLHVKDNAVLIGDAVSGYATLNFHSTTDGSARYGSIRKNYDSPFDMRIRASNSTGTAPIIFENSNNSEAMRIDSSGNVGIGTTNPASLLTIQDATPVFEIDSTTTSNTATIQFTSSGTVDSKITHVGNTGVMTIDSGRNSSWGGKIAFVTDTVERMRIDNSGNVGIGTASPGRILTVSDTSSSPFISIIGSASNEGGILFGDNISDAAGQLRYNHPSNYMYFSTEGTERMRIDSSGNLLVGKTSASATGSGTELRGTQVIIGKTSSGTVNGIYFNHNSTYVGGLNYTDTSTALATSSDERLKKNIADADDAGSKVDAMQVRKFDWKADGSHQEYGFIAQELEPVFGHAVHTAEDDMQTKSVDYASLVPMLVKEIQSLRNRVAQLENS